MWPAAVFAGYHLAPYAAAETEYNSNIFDLRGHDQASAQNAGDKTMDDILLRDFVGVDASLLWGPQKLRATVEGRRVSFIHFDRLDHNEYLLGAGFDWHLTRVVDGALEFRQERRMASFADRNSTALTLERERTGSGTVNLAIDPEWRLETGLRTHELASPLPDFPGFRLKENAVNTAIKYLGIELLNAGVFAEYLKGQFDGIPEKDKFHQENLSLTADYTIKGLEHVGAQLGYTRRRDAIGGNASGLTGQLAFHRALTVKTSMDVRAFRRVDSYVGGASSEIETGAEATLAWQATEKMLLAADYQWVTSKFEQASPSSGPTRKDDAQLASLKLTYQALQWLLVRPYAGYNVRDSNIEIDSFDSVFGGLELQARFEQPN